MSINETKNNGEKISFYELLQKSEVSKIIIPIIQRDYAQGREDNHVISEIRSKFVGSLKDAITRDEAITLDCVYGFIDAEKCFIPIDGQQRLTTLFLLHWYTTISAGLLDESNAKLLGKFTYQVRDSAKEFCESMTNVSHNLDFIDKSPSDSIKNSKWYHCGVFDADPTISGMLIMLDEIHKQFSGMDMDSIYKKLFSENAPLQFWWLKIDNFGLADDLFIKMNARGKRLTRFEIFKSELESALPDSPLMDVWKEKIDNDWFECFWNYYGNDAPQKAEHALFRYLLFVVSSLQAQQKSEKWEIPADDIEQTDYSETIDTLKHEYNFKFLCSSFDLLNNIISNEQLTNYQDDFRKLLEGSKMGYWEYARLFSVIDYVIRYDAEISEFAAYERVLNNLIAAQREPNKRDMFFASQIDAKSYGPFVKGVDTCILGAINRGSILSALATSSESIAGLQGYDAEVEKAKIIINNPSEADSLYSLESLPEFKGLIHNVIYDKGLCITLEQVNKLLENKQLFLRIVQSFSDELLLLRVGYLWPVPFGEGEEYSYRKHRYWFNKRINGDFLLASGSGETIKWQQPVQTALITLSALSFESTEKEMRELLEERADNLSYKCCADYFVKYKEFYTDEESSCCLLPETEALSEYKLLCCTRDWNILYNPFCYVLAGKLGLEYEPVGILSDSLKVREDVIFTIMNDGSWLVEISNENLKCNVSHFLSGESKNALIPEQGADCIECAEKFVKSHLMNDTEGVRV